MKKFLSIALVCITLFTLLTGCRNDLPTDSDNTDTLPSSESENEIIKSYDSEQFISPKQDKNDSFLVKGEKYGYNGNDVLILNVENQTGEDYSIEITVSFFDSDGIQVHSQSKSFRGFASGWQNYFIFNTGKTFESYEIEMTFEEYLDTAYSKYIIASGMPKGVTANLYISRTMLDHIKGEYLDDWYTAINADFYISNTHTSELSIGADFVIIDNNGEIQLYESFPNMGIISPTQESRKTRKMYITDILWKDRADFVWPDNLVGDIIGLISVTAVSTEQQ